MDASYDKAGTFGDPDGGREDFGRFIQFEPGKAWGGLAMRPGDLTVRAIVGGKGSGKTIYKRMLEDGASENSDVYVFRHSLQGPPTQLIQRFTQEIELERAETSDLAPAVVSYSALFEDNLRTEQWQHLWRRAIFRSVASLFYSNRTPSDLSVQSMPTKEFYTAFSNIVPRQFKTPESIFNQVTDVISRFPKIKQMNDYLHHPLWESFETILLENLRANRPVCYFIDAIDEDFRHAPSEWLDCQKGLFYQIMRMLRDNVINNGLHICICIRDIVYSSIMQSSEHATRYLTGDHIRKLVWSRISATIFLKKKIESLLPTALINPNSADLAEAWLGRTIIHNEKRDVEENIFDYILRHTRFLPRDIINIGNALCLKVEEAKAQNQTLTEKEIREAVSWVAGKIGNEAIRICGNHLAVSSLPNYDLKKIYARHGADSIPSDWAAKLIADALREIGKDVVKFDELQAVLSKYQAEFNGAVATQYMQYRIDTVLWQHGLLGYRDAEEGPCSFYNAAKETFFLPTDRETYVLHPSLIDALGLKSVGRYPIAG